MEEAIENGLIWQRIIKPRREALALVKEETLGAELGGGEGGVDDILMKDGGEGEEEPEAMMQMPAKRKRGRPKKSEQPENK